MRVVWAGTFEPEFSRNLKLRRLLDLSGVETIVIRQRLWPSDRVGLVNRGWGRLLGKALVVYPLLVWRLLTERAPDVYLVSYPGWFDLPAVWLVSKLKRRPIVFDPFISLHDTVVADRSLQSDRSTIGKMAKSADRWSLRLADIVLADTEPHLDLYESLAPGTAKKGRVLPVGADDEVFRPRSDVEPEPGRVLFYGSMVPLQGVRTIVEAAARLADAGVHFTLIGDGQDRPALEAVIERTGVDVELHGILPLDRLPEHISRAQVCLGIFGTSDKAGRVVPHKLYEALAMGRAVVTRDGPGVRSLLESEEVLTVPPGDADALAQRIRDLVDDPMLRSQVETAGHAAYQSRFHEDRLADLLLRTLQIAAE